MAPRVGHVSVLLLDGRLLVAGGTDRRAELVSLESFSWLSSRPAGELATERTEACGSMLPDGRVWLVGGRREGNFHATSELYDPVTNAWGPGPQLGSPRARATATLLLSGEVLVVGGEGGPGNVLRSTLLFDSTKGDLREGPLLKEPRVEHTSTLMPDGRVLVCGGRSDAARALKSCESYAPGALEWAAAPELSTARFGHAAVSLSNGDVVVAGGRDAQDLASMEQLDAKSQRWVDAGTLPEPRYRLAAVLSGTTIGFVGGTSNGEPVVQSAIFDPSSGRRLPYNTPTYSERLLVPPNSVLPTATRASAGTIVVGGSEAATLAFGGETGVRDTPAASRHQGRYRALIRLADGRLAAFGGEGAAVNNAHVFDPVREAWEYPNGPVLAGRTSAVRVGANRIALLAAGAFGESTRAWVLDEATWAWTETGSRKTTSEFHTATSFAGNRVLLVTREGRAEFFEPASNEWTLLPSLGEVRDRHTASPLANGDVLVVGGTSEVHAALRTTRVFNARTRSWTAGPPLNVPRRDHAAVALADGRVVVAGGAEGEASAELWDPRTNSWKLMGSMAKGRADFTLVELKDGRVLAAGDQDTVELLDLATSSWAVADILGTRWGATASVMDRGAVLILGRNPTDWYRDRIFDPRPPAALPVIEAVPATAVPGATITVRGRGFRGLTEANGGGAQQSAANYPVGAGVLSFSDTHIEFRLPCHIRPGEQHFDFFISDVRASFSLEIALAAPNFNCPIGSECEDGDYCTVLDRWTAAGECVGEAYSCADNTCSLAWCDGGGGCIRVPRDPVPPCDDGDPCTAADACQSDGMCAGESTAACVPGGVGGAAGSGGVAGGSGHAGALSLGGHSQGGAANAGAGGAARPWTPSGGLAGVAGSVGLAGDSNGVGGASTAAGAPALPPDYIAPRREPTPVSSRGCTCATARGEAPWAGWGALASVLALAFARRGRSPRTGARRLAASAALSASALPSSCGSDGSTRAPG
jgi:hypothetical protein